jgi:hypothetical protein
MLTFSDIFPDRIDSLEAVPGFLTDGFLIIFSEEGVQCDFSMLLACNWSILLTLGSK